MAEQVVTDKSEYGTADMYRQIMNEVGAPIEAAMSKASEAVKAITKAQTFIGVGQRCPDGLVALGYGSLALCDEKQG
ncbi:hypothetical protein ACFQ48_14540 [Hymenobacter caeli]|uniref:Uncharacterized protein n=1 Tax=Hymenobacter caeli TaxID=2735894 RepID=A0ABX2FUI3_9BACT|nr:hypothetical protein [Hymenobacter caeli]NRT20139.1 hypothetical protein [Hymenobacter caeli]